MSNSKFIDLFMRLNPDLKITFQADYPKNNQEEYKYIKLESDKSGYHYFNKGIFRFQETSSGYKKFVTTSKIKEQLVEEVRFNGNALCRIFYDSNKTPKFIFNYVKKSDYIREEISNEFDELLERSIYRANSENDIDFPSVCFKGRLSHHYPRYILGKYQILFGENCTRSTYDYNGNLSQQEIHKDGKIVKIKQKQNWLEKLLGRPRLHVSYTDNEYGIRRKEMIERVRESRKQLSDSEFSQIRKDNASFFRYVIQKQR